MTRDQAVARAASLNATADADVHWLPQPGTDGWKLVKLEGEGVAAQRASGAHVESRPRPEQGDDPRPAILRNIPPYGA